MLITFCSMGKISACWEHLSAVILFEVHPNGFLKESLWIPKGRNVLINSPAKHG